MARSRNIKPGFFTNDDLVELDFATRLLFAGLWTIADREGRMEDRPKKIKIDIFPSDSLDVDAMLQSLHASDFIQRYEVDGKKFIQINTWAKHQNPHHTEKESTIPCINGYLTVKDKAKTVNSQVQDGENLADSGFLIPDSLLLIPDPGFLMPDSPIPDSNTRPPNTVYAAPATQDAAPPQIPKRPTKSKKEPTMGSEVWQSYAAEYLIVYGTEPMRNAKVNSMLAQFVGRVPANEASDIARHYVRNKNGFYVSRGHSVEYLLKDAEKHRTEWFTGRHVTQTQAQQIDKTQTNHNAFAPLLAEALERQNATDQP